MRKRLLAGILVATLSVALFAGCGDKSKNDSDVAEETAVTEEKEDATAETKGEDTEEVDAEAESETPGYTFSDMTKTMYAKSSVNVRSLPNTEGEKVGSLSKNQEVSVTGQCNETNWYRITYKDTIAYVSNDYLVKDKLVEEAKTESASTQTQTASATTECPYPLYQVIDEGGDQVYFYCLGGPEKGNSTEFWTCYNQVCGILASRHGAVYVYDGPVLVNGGMDNVGIHCISGDEVSTPYTVNGQKVMKARPVVVLGSHEVAGEAVGAE